MKLGVLVETEEGLDWDHWRGTVAAVERLGLDSVWISDHLESPWSARRRGLEPWTALAVAAASTERIVVGPLVSPVTFREPALVARMTANLADLTQGRFVVGLGLGWNDQEHVTAEIRFPSVTERSQRLITTIQRVRSESSTPVLVGGKGRRSTLPIVARYADEWNVTPSSLVDYMHSVCEVTRLCTEVGRDPNELYRSVAVGLLLGRDAKALDARSERMRSIVKPLAEAEDVVAAARRLGWAAGTPDEVIAAIRAFQEAGVQRVILGFYDLDDTSMLELLADEVLPAVA